MRLSSHGHNSKAEITLKLYEIVKSKKVYVVRRPKSGNTFNFFHILKQQNKEYVKCKSE